MLRDRKYEGFSLIEILIVVGLILILAAVTIVAINPAKHFQDTRNAERSADVSEILNAITQYTAEEGRTLRDLDEDPTADPPLIIPTCDRDWDEAGDINTVVDVGALVPEYIVEIPRDPQATGDLAGYRICENGGRVQILAQEEGTGDLIVATR